MFNHLDINEETILIGHSCGADFLIRWLSENKTKVGKTALVTPFLDPDHDEVKSDFFNFKIDSTIQNRVQEISIFYSTDDEQEILTNVAQIKESIPNVEIKVFKDKGHFTRK